MPPLTEDKLASLGFQSVGKGVRISDKASFYNTPKISIADGVRIDDFCILSAGDGGISIGRFVHIGCYSSLIGAGPIVFEDFTGVSGRVSIYSSCDDFSGHAMVHPTIPNEYRNVTNGPVTLRRHALIGAGSVVLPNVEIGRGVVVAALSLVKDDCQEFCMYGGCPARVLGTRSRELLLQETEFLASLDRGR